jgi:hypothetical protein
VALPWATEVGAELRPGLGHSWGVELTAPSRVTFETGGDAIDTVLYLSDADANELAVDDDGGPDRLSLLEAELEAGSYVVSVLGYDDAETGAFTLVGRCAGEGCGGDPEPPVDPEDPWAPAKDITRMRVTFDDRTPIPESFTRADGISPLSLSSPEWWQRWSGGATQSFSWDAGTDYGKRCGQASAIRLQAIWESDEGRAAFTALLDGSGWGGTMYNWTEDVSQGGHPVFSPATMWAWRTGAVKWINVVHPDGSCDLPTLDLVQRFSETCLAQAARDDGAIQGCRASGR